ncbi:ethylene-responsive transcription factor ERF019-like [Tasmannia lanceolata]|uniref:ethylene-responsive transcription factor ERF019-like n=1 Tax=Tasmannia lanceolata TaxID=3420 RepID=UPI004062BA98
MSGRISERKYKGVRRRKWGKWVSEIRLQGSRTRLWLGSYSAPEAAAVAHDTAMFYLRGPSSIENLNFPMSVPMFYQADMSPTSVQSVATNAGMAVDATLITRLPENDVKLPENGGFQGLEISIWEDEDNSKVCGSFELREGEALSISIDDMEICI